ncbi:PaaI family thioesterase [Neobacillus sp. MM2021_6]|uniref:PaaI family thioesterase n=1 Tax=Bacillaceae TaxID=186817 RepID=UPI00140C9E16|nr:MULTISPECIES: PaaI family thioesterase [Bacillaceae]MBO0959237.1 PaaI family thioesterase [Neobacillus sp. MM2021_6]NHC16844.1 PaaI family thioesterase [Bacillus sp. MM2020_4]WML38974.1 PaaI family thioesterase [Neobacillus sp. OS1-2]
MKDELRRLLETCLETGSETDLQAIATLLEGVQRKIKRNRNTFIDGLLHMERSFDQNSCEITIPINPIINNDLSIVHGGITATVLDSAMGVMAYQQLPEGFAAVTNQLNIHYIAPGIGDSLRCKAEIIHQGSKTMVISGEVYRSDGKKIAYATGTFFIIKK